MAIFDALYAHLMPFIQRTPSEYRHNSYINGRYLNLQLAKTRRSGASRLRASLVTFGPSIVVPPNISLALPQIQICHYTPGHCDSYL